MPALQKLKQYLLRFSAGSEKKTAPAKAYNLWAESYDSQPGNLMLALDEEIFSRLLQKINLKNKIIADIGCGTGRHWKKIMKEMPRKIIGYDISESMLNILLKKYPDAETHLLKNNFLQELEDESCDLVISTLTVAHIENMEEALNEWKRILKPDGSIIITDYHPCLLAKGGKRTFYHHQKLVAIKNHIHPVENIKRFAEKNALREINFIEKKIDDEVKYYYEKQNAIAVFEKFKDTPVIYGIHFIKR